MQPTKKLTEVLRELLALVDEEARQNPAFAVRLDAILSAVPQRPRLPRSRRKPVDLRDLPDVAAAFREKGDEEFRFWLRALPLVELKAIVRVNGFDATRRSDKWTDPEKFMALIVEQTASRARRGSAFLTHTTPPPGPPTT